MLIFKETSASTDSLYAKSYNGLNKQKWMIQNIFNRKLTLL